MRALIIIVIMLLFISGCTELQSIQKAEIPTEELKEEKEENCTTGWKCLDANRKGYQFSNCVFTQVNVCEHGCKDGECISLPPEEEEKEKTLAKKGVGRLGKLGWKSCDFSESQIFEDGVTEQDFKIKLYAKVLGYNYFEVEGPRSNIWVIDKAIADATMSDCIEKIEDANTYNYLRTKQTVCIKTKEENIALVGGYWDGSPNEDTKLNWKYYSD